MIDETLHPVWYAVSHKFSNTAERNYAPRDQEMLAVIYSLRKFHSGIFVVSKIPVVL